MDKIKFCIAFLLIHFTVAGLSQTPFTSGNIVVYRIGDGGVQLSSGNATPVFLDEYTPTGTLVQSIAMPTTVNGTNKILTSGSDYSSGGWLSRSTNGQYLVLTGFNADPGTASVQYDPAFERVIGLVNYNGSINTSTSPSGWTNGGSPLAAISTDGINIWAVNDLSSGASSGVTYMTAGSSGFTQLNTVLPRLFNFINIADAQLYVTVSSPPRARVGKLGTGLPTTGGQVFTGLPGLPNSTSTYQFVFLDLDPATPGSDVLYAADDGVGIVKYSLVGGVWVSNGSIGTDADDYRGLTASVSGTTVTLFATRMGNNVISGGGELVKLTDASGYNGALTGSPSVLATVPTADYYSFEGLALAPVKPAACTSPAPPAISNITPSSAMITWNAVGGSAGYEYAVTTSATPPVSGTGTTATSYQATGLTPGTQYYAHVRTNCGSFNFSSWVTTPFTSETGFTSGNIVVYRIGDGGVQLSSGNATPVFLDEYTPTGTLVQSIAMPTTVNGTNKILTSGSDYSSGGWLSRSTNGQYLVLTGFNADSGTASVQYDPAFERVIGLVNYNGSINTSTSPSGWTNGGSPLAAISTDGINIWAVNDLSSGASSGVTYMTAGSSGFTQLNTVLPRLFNFINIADAQLYVTVSSPPRARVGKLGTGLPTTGGQVFTGLPGLPNSTSTYQFVFLDLDPATPGSDVLYAADDGVGIIKYSLVGGVWVSNGSIGTDADDYRGLTASVSGTTVTLFATRIGNNVISGGGELVKLTDASGYNGALTGSPSVLATVPTADYYSFIGVALAPVKPAACTSPTAPAISNITPTSAMITWNAVVGSAGYEYAVTTSATPPVSGTGTTATSYQASGLTPGTQYYAHVRTNCGTFNFSSWVTTPFIPTCLPPPVPALANIDNSVKITWRTVYGAAGYEYAITSSVVPPASGIAITDTTYTASNLSSITQYYFHVRTNCGSGNFSPWATLPFNTSCFTPTLTVGDITGDGATLNWTSSINATGYEYAITYYPAPPLSGVGTTDTFYHVSKTLPGTGYYFHVRAKCGTSNISDWVTLLFNTTGLEAYPNPVRDMLTIKLNGAGSISGEISIGDAMGRIIKQVPMTGTSLDVPVNGLAAGIYLIQYNDGNRKYLFRVMKQ